MQTCKRCGELKESSDFERYRRVCKSCMKAQAAAWRAKNADHLRAYYREQRRKQRQDPTYKARETARRRKYAPRYRPKNLAYMQKRQAERQDILWKIKDVPCADCHQSFPPYVMDFDHITGDKSGNLSEMKSYSIERILEEIAKCDIVCANCHRIRTYRRNNMQLIETKAS